MNAQIEPEPQDRFLDRVDAHINLSNTQHKTDNPIHVGASGLFAAARYCVWLAARATTSAEELKAKREEFISLFSGQFNQMLNDNLDDYEQNFDRLLK